MIELSARGLTALTAPFEDVSLDHQVGEQPHDERTSEGDQDDAQSYHSHKNLIADDAHMEGNTAR